MSFSGLHKSSQVTSVCRHQPPCLTSRGLQMIDQARASLEESTEIQIQEIKKTTPRSSRENVVV